MPEAAKAQLRQRLSAARRAVPAAVRHAEAAALAATLTATPLPPGSTGPICAYWPVGSEPGSPAMLDGLRDRGFRVLLPVIGIVATPTAGDPGRTATGPLDWAEYTGAASLRAGPFGVREPAGPRLGHAAIAAAGLILVPALAVDHRGVRLGRGGGYYDRTLPLALPGTPLVAVVRDEEVLAALPAEPHDVLVTAVLTPGRGLLPLPAGRPHHRP